MRLSDIMSAAGLAFYPQVALLIFLVVFVLACIRILRPSRAVRYSQFATLPLEDAPTTLPSQRQRSHAS